VGGLVVGGDRADREWLYPRKPLNGSAERVVLAPEQEPLRDKPSVQWLEMPSGVMPLQLHCPCCLVGG